MSKVIFIEVPAGKKSIAQRRLIHGVGLNDATYNTSLEIDGKTVKCPYYRRWRDMIKRCYSHKLQNSCPTYKGCSVCDDWLIFSNFKEWMIRQNWEGMHLDKGVLSPGNKVYSPDTCRFITQGLNLLLVDNAASRGKYPLGVYLNKQCGKYQAAVSVDHESIYLGVYLTPELASEAYIKAKVGIILRASIEHDDPMVSRGLRLHAELLKDKS